MQQTPGTTMPEEKSPLSEYRLDNVDCSICGNTGTVTRIDENGFLWSRDCVCMKRRRSLRNIEDSGLRDLVRRYSFENYKTPTPKHDAIKKKAMSFCANDAECFIIMGKSGAGKTHICTAICKTLIENNWQCRYLIWRTDAARLKSIVNDGEEYEREINKLKNSAVLYIDDFFKGTITDADKNLAFTLLNDRYNGRGKKTIISTELTIPELLEADEATAGRIIERARGYTIQAPSENWRLK